MMKGRSVKKQKSIYSGWFLAPVIIIFGGLFLLPTVISFFFSMTVWDLTSWTWAGLDNFIQFFSEYSLRIGIKNTFIYAILTCVLKVVFGLLLAVMLLALCLGHLGQTLSLGHSVIDLLLDRGRHLALLRLKSFGDAPVKLCLHAVLLQELIKRGQVAAVFLLRPGCSIAACGPRGCAGLLLCVGLCAGILGAGLSVGIGICHVYPSFLCARRIRIRARGIRNLSLLYVYIIKRAGRPRLLDHLCCQAVEVQQPHFSGL